MGKRKREAQAAIASGLAEASARAPPSSHNKKTKHSKSPFPHSDVKPIVGQASGSGFGRGKQDHKRKRGFSSVSVSPILRSSAPSSVTLQDAGQEESDDDVEESLSKKRRRRKAVKLEADLVNGKLESEAEGEEKPSDSALAMIASSALVGPAKEEEQVEDVQPDVKPKVEDISSEIEDVKPKLEEPKPKAKKSKGKGKALGWAPGLDSSLVAVPFTVSAVPAIAEGQTAQQMEHTQTVPSMEEFEALKIEVERLKNEMSFKQELLLVHQEMTTFVQESLNCSICLSTYIDPLALSCGHVFCRNCLKTCFTHSRAQASTSSSRIKLECPACRHAVLTRPFPVFVVRDLTARIRQHERAGGLLFAGGSERGQTKSPARKIEGLPDVDEWDGLFQNQDRNITYAHAVRRGMLDADDNVMRCLQCNWELEDDVCLHCGAIYDGGHMSDFDDQIAAVFSPLSSASMSEDEEGNISDLIETTQDETIVQEDDSELDAEPLGNSRARRRARRLARNDMEQLFRDRYGPDESSQEEDEDEEGLNESIDLRDHTQRYSSEEDEENDFSQDEGESRPAPSRPYLKVPEESDSEEDSGSEEHHHSKRHREDQDETRYRRLVRGAASESESVIDTEESEAEETDQAIVRRKRRIADSDEEEEEEEVPVELEIRRTRIPSSDREEGEIDGGPVFMHEPNDYSDLEPMEGEDLGGRGLQAAGQYMLPDSDIGEMSGDASDVRHSAEEEEEGY